MEHVEPVVSTRIAKRGRKPLYLTAEEKQEARARHRKTAKAKTKNVTMDNDVQEKINELQDALEARLGFRPSISQSLRLVFKHLDVENMKL